MRFRRTLAEPEEPVELNLIPLIDVIMFLLIYMRILSSAFLRRHHRNFILVNAIASSILTPVKKLLLIRY